MTTPTGTLAPDVPRNAILCGNALEEMRRLPDSCVQTVVTSLPYLWKRDYGNTPTVWGGVSTCAHHWDTPQPPSNPRQKPQSNINGKGNKSLKSGPVNSTATTGWKPTCRCQDITGTGRCLAFDPFIGAGTVGVVAQRLGRDYLGVELNPAYVAMAEERIIRDTLPPAMKDVDLSLLPRSLFDDVEVA